MHGEDKPSRKKKFFPISTELRQYLKTHGRESVLPVSYSDLLEIKYAVPLLDKAGKDTLWEKALYEKNHWHYLKEGLINLYAILKTEGDYTFTKHLDVARIDYCTFGNSHPFRIRIVNRYNDNYDHYYIKKEDASRVYGLELEHILSPNRMTFLTHNNTLVEEHIPGIPGDVFVKDYFDRPETNKIRIAKEFVKFNERCFLRLLGDMRSYNFVVEITPDIEDYQYRIRAIDFDQQSYEGRKNLYLPQFFKENYPFVELTLKYLNKDSIEQYRAEERTLIAYRIAASRYRIMDLLKIMSKDSISTDEKRKQLKHELAEHFQTTTFNRCKTMGELVKTTLRVALKPHLFRIQRNLGKITD
ncbi:hypothetical protein [Flavisolibacter ginsenosidimutans]|uniref:Uncharacterized protein n=1 Tax=Flavisolibacter ginsenosidimutans TaxID=661481 RepID=A0A5B8UCX9_9BACT|nr:hypothetical protein [Flavisolibacter ginsenosidimutans]QEC54521.1 hypothetical protein FSB75_00930 [Flavisolibacter ginsenosidimutans]